MTNPTDKEMTTRPGVGDDSLDKLSMAELELRELRAKVRQLELDLMQPAFVRKAAPWLSFCTALGMLGSVLAFVWNENTARSKAAEERQEDFQNRTEAITREAAQPFWENQLALYLKAAEAAATIATSKDPGARERAEDTFWMLYWGPLACVEDRALIAPKKNSVEGAMVAFGEALKSKAEASEMERLALAISHAMRDQIAPEFDLKQPDAVDKVKDEGKNAKQPK